MQTTRKSAGRRALGALLFPVALAAGAQPARLDLAGTYSLASSTTAPVTNWGFTKGRFTIKKLDDNHLQLVFACEWKREPKAVCGDHFYAQWQDQGLYLQDMNTGNMRIYFEPATRSLTVITRGSDAKASVRRDVYKPDGQELTDPALIRRMKREQSNADSTENRRVFGPYSKWAYTNNRIELQNQ
jgi:hypothetical protein